MNMKREQQGTGAFDIVNSEKKKSCYRLFYFILVLNYLPYPGKNEF